jgi:hypothetical protein
MIQSGKQFRLSRRAGARRSLGVGVIAALLVALQVAIAPAASASSATGGLSPDATAKVLSQKPQRVGVVVPVGRRSIPLLTPDPAQLGAAKARAAARLGGGALLSPSTSASSPTPAAAVFGGLNSAGMSAGGSETPPDTTGAIGPGNYLEFVNDTGVTAYNRNLSPVSGPVGLGNFIGYPSDEVFDPQIQWDQNWGRWIYVMDDIEEPFSSNWLAFGWSKTADPTDLSTEEPGAGTGAGWCSYFLYTGSEFDDYPKLGHGNSGITIGSNVFNLETGEFLTARIWSISKPPSPGTCPEWEAFEPGTELTVEAFGSPAEPLETADGDTAFTPVPANTADSSSASYVVAADSRYFTPDAQIMGWHVNGGGEGATLVEDGNMNVEPFEMPANVPQPGTSKVIDSSDARLTNAVAANDPAVGQEAVWTQHTIEGPGGRSEVRWYELLPGTQTVRQEGTISDPSRFVFNAAISPTREGDAAAIDFNRGSAALSPDMHAQSRAAGTPLSEMEGDVLLGTSSGSAQDFSCTPCRWGDYAGASPDPAVGGLVWGSNQGLSAPSGPSDEDAHWTTRNFALFVQLDTTIGSGPPSATNDSTPTFAFSANEPSATFECKVDGGSFAACVSPFTTPVLGDGSHTFQVRATQGGNTDPTPASRTFTVETTVPPSSAPPPSAPPPAVASAGPSGPSAACLKAKRALKKAKKQLKAAKTPAQKKKAKAAIKKAKRAIKKYC